MRDLTDRGPCEDRGCDCCLRFREEWTAGSIYRPGEAVPYNGSSYVAIHLNTNDPPPSGNWALIASKGDTGPAGPVGPAGSDGAQGPPGQAGAGGGGDAYSTLKFDHQTGLGLVSEGIDIASLSLPFGSYILMASLTMINVDGDTQNFTLELRTGATVLTTGAGSIGSDDQGSGVLVAPFVATSDSSTDVTFRGYGYNIVANNDVDNPYSFVAIRVGIIHES